MHDHPDDDVESLLRLAGRRQRLSAAELEPIHAAARSAWRRHVRRTVWTRRAGLGAVALAAGLLLVLGLRFGWRGPAEPLATLALQTGEVSLSGALTDGSGLAAGSVVATGAGGRAALHLIAGPSLRLDVATVVRLDTADQLTLERGAVYVDADPAAHGRPVEVATVLGSIHHIGTQFEVRLLTDEPPSTASSLRVRVREGAVRVEGRAQSWRVEAGSELTVGTAGGARKTRVAPAGESWEWTQRAAPALEIDGATLAVFLAWVSRETGLGWHYADPSLESAAREIVLHGSIEGLTPTEALAAVLPGCGLRHRQIEQGWWLESDYRQ